MKKFYYEKDITEDMMVNRPFAMFVFGDNILRRGYGGLAKVCRGKINSIGVATKVKPSMEEDSFFSDNNYFHWGIMTHDLSEVARACEDFSIVCPWHPIGGGTSLMHQKAPKMFRFMLSFFHNLDPNCPWPR